MEAIRGVSFHIRKGEKIALVGPNGAGKSTLMLMFNGMLRPDSGTMLFDDVPIRYDKASLRTLRRRVGFVLQNPDRQIIAPTVYQDVAFGPANLGYDEEAVRQAVTLALRQVGLEGFERRPLESLSGGQLQRVRFAQIIVQDARLILLDEPFNALDETTEEEFLTLIHRWHEEGRTVIAVLHDLAACAATFP